MLPINNIKPSIEEVLYEWISIIHIDIEQLIYIRICKEFKVKDRIS